jgi:hypothetical protein
MIQRSFAKLSRKITAFTFCDIRKPIIFGNGRSVFSLSQLWSGTCEKPFDHFVKDDLNVKIDK